MNQRVEVKFLEKDKFEVRAISSETTIYVDKKEPGLAPAGPNPLELFLSSLASCSGVFAKRYLERHNLEFKELRIEVEAEFTTETPMRLTKIKTKVYTDADLGNKREVFLRFIEGCPIHNTILHTERIDIELG